MHNRYSINLAWPSGQKSFKEEYRTWIELCKEYNINIIRVFLVPWGLNPVDSPEDLPLLCEVIQLAQKHSIEVVLVLDTYVNYVKYSYRDFLNSEYGWFNNPCSDAQSLESFLEGNGRTQYIEKISSVLRTVAQYNNVNSIELCNEIDQIEASRNQIVGWINNSYGILLQQYGNRFQYRISISDYRAYSYFAKRIKCRCDIHSYRFPYNTALENYEYLTNTFSTAWISEFACFSDYAYADSIESLTYFCSMLLCAAFEKCADYPASWWWEKILQDTSYMNVYKYLDDIKGEFVRSKIEGFSVKEIKQIRMLRDSKMQDKIRYRLSVLKRNPKLLKQELPAITKFIRKKLWPKYNHKFATTGFKSLDGILYIILETYVPIEVLYETGESLSRFLICQDMIRKMEKIAINVNESKTLKEGIYLLIIRNV